MLNIFINPHQNTGINLQTRHIQPDEPQRIDTLWQDKIISLVLKEDIPEIEIWSIDENSEPNKLISSRKLTSMLVKEFNIDYLLSKINNDNL